jgi:carbonic anhydrase/acetyltransferase-like protein (isoleucine patch superfamily)
VTGRIRLGTRFPESAMLLPYKGVSPRLHPSVFVAEGARIVGDVEIGESSSVWFNTVIRGDIAPVRIGRRSNVQDGCVLHVKNGLPVTVGDEVTFGHGVMAHACVVEDLCLLGIGCVILDGAVIGRGSVVGAGAVVSPGTIVPPNSLVLGVPGKVARNLGPESAERNRGLADGYVGHAKAYLEGGR